MATKKTLIKSNTYTKIPNNFLPYSKLLGSKFNIYHDLNTQNEEKKTVSQSTVETTAISDMDFPEELKPRDWSESDLEDENIDKTIQEMAAIDIADIVHDTEIGTFSMLPKSPVKPMGDEIGAACSNFDVFSSSTSTVCDTF